jgi:hypothetical protein
VKYNDILNAALENNDGLAHILSGVAAGGGSVGVANTGMAIYLYNFVTEPADIDAAIDITNASTTATLLGVVLANPGSNYGLTFDAVAGSVLPKKASETWSTGNLAAFQGQLHASGTAPITHFLIAKLPDDGHSLNTTRPRILVSIGQVGSGDTGKDLMIANKVVTVGSPFTLSAFQFS